MDYKLKIGDIPTIVNSIESNRKFYEKLHNLVKEEAFFREEAGVFYFAQGNDKKEIFHSKYQKIGLLVQSGKLVELIWATGGLDGFEKSFGALCSIFKERGRNIEKKIITELPTITYILSYFITDNVFDYYYGKEKNGMIILYGLKDVVFK
jgi:hypothetical protein